MAELFLIWYLNPREVRKVVLSGNLNRKVIQDRWNLTEIDLRILDLIIKTFSSKETE